MAVSWRSQYLRYKGYFLNVWTIYKSRRDLKIFMEIILSLATVSLFGVFALKPTLITIFALYKEIKSKEETVKILDTKIQNLKEAEVAVEREQFRLSLIESAIPETPSPETFVRQVEGLAAKAQITLVGISLDEVTLLGKIKEKPKKEGLAQLPQGAEGVFFTINASGNYATLSSFLSLLQNARRPIKTDAVNLSTSEVETEKILILAVSGRVPYLTNP